MQRIFASSFVDHLTSARPLLRYVCLPVRPQDEEITANRRATLPRLQSTLSSSSRSIATRSNAFGIDTAGAHVYWRNPAVSRGLLQRKAIPRQALIILSAATSRRGSQLDSAFDCSLQIPPCPLHFSIRLTSHPQTFPATLSPS